MDLQTVLKKIETSSEIPTIGAVATEVMRLAGDPDSSFRDVGKVISGDPALTARILRVANSPYYGLRGEVATVERAVGLLGLNEVRNITLSVSVIADFSARCGGDGFNWDQFWEHSSGCALICQVLVRLLKLPTGGQEFVAGLLHDVGKIVLGHHFPDEFNQAVELASTGDLTMDQAETRVFGTEHARLGEWLAARWNFPEAIREAVGKHHRPEAAENGRALAAVVHLGDLFAKIKCIGFGGDFVAVCLPDDPAWKILAETSESLKDLDVERFTFHLDREVDAARELLRVAREP